MVLYLTILWFVLKKVKNFSMYMGYKVFLLVLILSNFVNKEENSVIIGVIQKVIVLMEFVIVLMDLGVVIVLKQTLIVLGVLQLIMIFGIL